MTKKKQVGVRFDSNRTRLKTGETQRPNGTYAYRWSTPDGKRHSIYAPTLEKLRAGRTNHRGQARRNTVGCQKHHCK